MKTENAIEVHNVVKKFRVYLDRGYTLKEIALFKKRRKFEERIVLNDISFEVKKGQAVGLIGQNGCGKSTTLKLLTRIMYPDSGTIEMKGRVSSLIELGAGFHPDMSGRQNIYTNASIFGLSRHEIDKRIDDIIAFSELREYIDNPVRTYSSGMYMRLAFAVAINVDADILLIDEILAVGDAAFQAKCFNRLREIKAMGTTIVIVSHSMGQIEQICDRAIWIKDGEIEEDGLPRGIIQTYMAWIMSGDKFSKVIEGEKENVGHVEKQIEPEEREDSFEYTLSEILELKKTGKCREIGNRDVEIVDYELLDASCMKRKDRFTIGEDILCRLYYRRNNPEIQETMCSFAIYRSDGLNCYSTNCFINTGKNVRLKDKGIIEFIIKNNPLMQGQYMFDLSLNKDYGPTYHGYVNACSFEVYNVRTDYGVCRPQVTWKLEAEAALEVTINNTKVNKENYLQELAINKILVLENGNENLQASNIQEYDMIEIAGFNHDLQKKNQLIMEAANYANYLLIRNATNYKFESQIDNCLFINGQDVLVPISTKNKVLIENIIMTMESVPTKKMWLLNAFLNEDIDVKWQIDCDKNEGNVELRITAKLINKRSENIFFLDKGIAFGSLVREGEKEVERSRIPIREIVYSGENIYSWILKEKRGSIIVLSVVKEGEYWINSYIPDCMENIEL